SIINTSAWTPRAIRLQDAHDPQASSPLNLPGSRQFISWASATAAMRFPTPSGPAKIRLGGSVPREVARAMRSSRCRWPAICRKDISVGGSYQKHRVLQVLPGLTRRGRLAALLLLIFLGLVLGILVGLLVAFAEYSGPESALLGGRGGVWLRRRFLSYLGRGRLMGTGRTRLSRRQTSLLRVNRLGRV